MSSRRPSPAPKRTVPIKRADGDPLTRLDIQYDVLNAIFSDSRTVFTNPYATATQENPQPKLTFHDLYINAVLNSSKATKALRDKMNDSTLFAEDFAMLAMLVNVGRINTTMSFFPEMKTAIRTYHPIPALQRSNGNLQDAPRIKHILKASLLEGENKNPPSTPSDVLARAKAGQVPATSIMNLIFVLANHSVPVGHHHFPDQNFDFLDIFLRHDVSSVSRARAFLYLCYFYLESPATGSAEDDYDGEAATNPFTDSNRGKGPALVVITPAEVALENVEPEDETVRKENLVAQRNRIINNHSKAKAGGGDEDEEMAGSGAEESKPKAGSSKRAASTKEKKAAPDKVRKKAVKSKRHVESGDDEDISAQVKPTGNKYPQVPSTSQPMQLQFSLDRRVIEHTETDRRRRRYSPYGLAPGNMQASRQGDHSQPPFVPRRTMLQHAWHIVNTTDSLVNSDDEMGDEHDRHDYIQRLQVLSRLRGKEPTPEPEPIQLVQR